MKQSTSASITRQKLIRRWDTRTWRDVSSYMVTP